MNRTIIVVGALLGGSAVVLGAFGAHALQGVLTPQAAGWWETAVQYQLAHALALLLTAVLPIRRAEAIAWCMGTGTVIFSGTLYAMALGAPRWFGAVTPVGGVLMILGWLLLGWGAMAGPEIRRSNSSITERTRI